MARTVPESGDFLVMVCALRWGFGGGHDWKEGLYGYGVLYSTSGQETGIGSALLIHAAKQAASYRTSKSCCLLPRT